MEIRMASSPTFAEFVLDQLAAAGAVHVKKMFGEYGVYCDGRIVALICDNQLFIKPTAAGRAFIGAPEESPPYTGAKPYFLIADGLDDSEWLSDLVRRTAAELAQTERAPVAKKTPRSRKSRTS
jgi:DNA transformation protein and related proteins